MADASSLISGASVANPYAAAFGAAASLGKAALQDQTSLTQSSRYDAAFDNSGFTVNVGSGTASTLTDKSQLPGVGQLTNALKNPMVLGAIVVLAIVYLKTRH